MIITTEWNMPGSVYQDTRYKEVTNGIVFPFYKLDNILKEDTSYAYQTEYVNGTYVGGTHLKRPSPMIYAYNYNFTIPHTAIIKKIELQQIVRQGSYTTRQNLKAKVIKLKTTASTTDGGGVNRNVAIGSKFATAPNWLDLITVITPETAGIELTPTLVNSPEFGQIFQAQGIMEGDVNGYGGERGWDDVQVAQMRIRITYDNPQPEINENNKKPTFNVTAGIKKTKKEKLAMDYPNQNTYIDITFERLPLNKVYYGGDTPQLKIYSENNIYLFGKEKYTTYLPKTQHFTTTTTKPEKITITVPVYPNWADNHGTIIIEWVENDVVKQKFVGLPITPWQELPDTFTEDTTSQGCIIANNKFDSCWAGIGGSYYIERCFDEIKLETQEEKEKYGIADAEGYALFPDVSRYMQGETGIEFPLGDSVTGECYTPMKFDPEEFTVTDAFNGAVEGEFTIREVQPFVIKKARKNPKNDKQYLKLDTSQSHRKTFSIEPEYYNPYLDKQILQGEGIVRIDFNMPPDIQSVRIKAIINENGTITKEDVTTHFMLEDYDLDTGKDKYFILAKYNFKEVVTNKWGDEEIAAVFPSFDFEMDYFEYVVTTDPWQPIRYKTIIDAEFNGTRTGTGTFYKIHYTPLIRVQKPIICTTNNTHTNILDITQNTWCKEPTGYVKEPCISPESQKVTPDLTITLSKNSITWTETITATVTATYNNIPISTDTPIPIKDNTGKQLGVATLENGTGSVKIKPQSTDVNKIIATWTETTRFFETTAQKNITVNKINPTLTVQPNKNNPEYNQNITFTTTAYYTDLTTQQQKPIASEMTLTIPLDNNQTTTKTIQTNSKGTNSTTHRITTRPATYTYQMTYAGNKNIATKTTNIPINEQKGTLTLTIDPEQSTKTARASHLRSLQLFTQIYDANTKQEITDAPAPFVFITPDTGGSDPIVQNGENTTSTSPFSVTSNSGEAFHGEVIDGKAVGYDDRPKEYYVRIIEHPYYDKSTNKVQDAEGNTLNWMVSNKIPITLIELETQIIALSFRNQAGTLMNEDNLSFKLPETIKVQGRLLFTVPPGHTVAGTENERPLVDPNQVRWYPLNKRLVLDGTEWKETGEINRPVASVSLQILQNDAIVYREFVPNQSGNFSYEWEAWNDTSESSPTHINKIRVQYRKQQSGIFKGYDTPERVINVSKADTSFLNYSTSVKNGEVTITGKIVWKDSGNNDSTNWDKYSNNEKVITPIIDGNYQGYRFYPSNDGTFNVSFIPSKNKTGTKPIYLQFNSTTLFNSSRSNTTNIKLS